MLHHARDEFGLSVPHVLHNRFGVWSRCMTSGDVRRYIGLNGASSYDEVRESIDEVGEDEMREVITDLSPRGERRPVLSELAGCHGVRKGAGTRNGTRSVATGRFDDLQVARQVVEVAELPARILNLRDRVDVARDQAEQRTECSEELLQATAALLGLPAAFGGPCGNCVGKTTVIEPRRDAYGPEADTSNLADYLELLALAGMQLRRAELADYLAEERWKVRSRELFYAPEDDASEEPSEDAEDGGVEASPAMVASEDVFSLLAARQRGARPALSLRRRGDRTSGR